MIKVLVRSSRFTALAYQPDFINRKKLFRYMVIIIRTCMSISSFTYFLNQNIGIDLVNTHKFICIRNNAKRIADA